MSKILLYCLSAILLIASMNSYADVKDKYFYIPESELYAMKELAMTGDRNAAYKLARYYDFYSDEQNSAYKAVLWYHISGLLGQPNGFSKAIGTLKLVSPIDIQAWENRGPDSDFLQFYPKEKFNVDDKYPKLSSLITFLYLNKHNKNDKNYEILKKYLLDNKVNLKIFLDEEYKRRPRYIFESLYISPDEINAMENLALKGNFRAALELSYYTSSYPSPHNKYSFLWDYVVNVIYSGAKKNIQTSYPYPYRKEKHNIVTTDDVFLTLGKDMTKSHDASMLSNFILYKYYYVIGDIAMVKKYKKILESNKINSNLLMHHEYSN